MVQDTLGLDVQIDLLPVLPLADQAIGQADRRLFGEASIENLGSLNKGKQQEVQPGGRVASFWHVAKI